MSSKGKSTTDRNEAFISSSAECQLSSAASAIIESQENKVRQLENGLNQVDAYIYTKDKMGRYIYVNQNVINIFDTSTENIIDHEDKEFFDLMLSDELMFNNKPRKKFNWRCAKKEFQY